MKMAPAPVPELLVFMSVAPDPAPELSFFHGSGFCSFSRINIFSCLGVRRVARKMNYIKYTKLREYTKLFYVI